MMTVSRPDLSTARQWLAWVRDHKNLALLLLLSIIATGVWGFVELADEVMEGDTQRFDESALAFINQFASPRLTSLMPDAVRRASRAKDDARG